MADAARITGGVVCKLCGDSNRRTPRKGRCCRGMFIVVTNTEKSTLVHFAGPAIALVSGATMFHSRGNCLINTSGRMNAVGTDDVGLHEPSLLHYYVLVIVRRQMLVGSVL